MPLHLKRKMRGTQGRMSLPGSADLPEPTMKIGLQVCEPLRVHEKLSKRAALARAVEILKRVGMRAPRWSSTTTRTSSRAACASAS